MIQDYLYLIDYTKVFALGAAKAKDLSAMKLFAGYTHAILDGEMDIHRAYMARLGITPEEAERRAVEKYTADDEPFTLPDIYQEEWSELNPRMTGVFGKRFFNYLRESESTVVEFAGMTPNGRRATYRIKEEQ